MLRSGSCGLLALVLSGCASSGSVAPASTVPSAARPSERAASEPSSPPPTERVDPGAPAAQAPALPDCWTTELRLDDAEERARVAAAARYLAEEIRAARTGEIGALVVVPDDAARLREVHALLDALHEDAEAWRCPEVRAYETLERDESAIDVRLVLRFGGPIGELDVRMHTNAGVSALGDRWDAWGGALRVVPSLLLADLTPRLAAAEGEHGELDVSRIGLAEGFDWWAVRTGADSFQCVRRVDGVRVLEAWCWRAPRHDGFLPAIEPSSVRRASRPDGSESIQLVVQTEPSVRWEVRVPEGTFAVRTGARSGPSRRIARVEPPDLGALGLVANGWHRSVRRIATPFGGAACGVRETFRCAYLRSE